MSDNDEIRELEKLYEENDFENLIEKMKDVESPIVLCIFQALILAEYEEVEKAREMIEKFDLDDFLNLSEMKALYMFRNIAINLCSFELVEKISRYLYEATENPKEMFGFYDIEICMKKNYDQCKEEIEFIKNNVINVEEFIRFSDFVQYIILKNFIIEEDERLFELSMLVSESVLINSNMLVDITKFFKSKGMDNEICKYIERLLPYMEFGYGAWSEFFDIYDIYVKAKNSLGVPVDTQDLLRLKNNFKYLAKYNKEYYNNIEEFKEELDEIQVGFIKILNGDNDVADVYTLKIYKYMIDKEFDEVIDIIHREKQYFGSSIGYARNLRVYDSSIYDDFIEFCIEKTNSRDENSIIGICVAEYLFSRGYHSEGENVIGKIDIDYKIDDIYKFLKNNTKNIKNRRLLGIFGYEILKISKNKSTSNKALEFILAFYFYENSDEFYNAFEEIKDTISEDLSNILYKTDDNYDKTRFLIEKKIKNLAFFYHCAFDEFTLINKDRLQDFEMAQHIIDIVIEFFGDDPDSLNFSRNCVETNKGICKFLFGEFQEAEEIIKNAAYNSPDYCNCGVAALLTVNDYIRPDESYELNKKIAYNSVHNLKLIGNDEYKKDDFENNIDILNRYAYYALKGEEKFDKNFILEELYKNEPSISRNYYIIKLLKELGRKEEIPYIKEGLIDLNKEGCCSLNERFLDILEDIDCPLYISQYFDRGFRFTGNVL